MDILSIGFVIGRGGDAWQMLDLAAGVAANGRSVEVIVRDHPMTAELVRRGRELGIQVVQSSAIRADEHGVGQSIPRLLWLFVSQRARLLHIHTGGVCLPRSVGLVLRLLRLRVIVTVHSPGTELVRADRRARQWASLVDSSVHAVVCPSEHARGTQIELGVAPARVRTITNGIDAVRFGSGVAARASTSLPVAADAPLIVFTSRMDEQKRPLDAVRAFARMASDHPTAHLVFVGSGQLEHAVRDECTELGLGERVHLVGYQANIPDWLAASTVWILPTANENYSLSILEAKAAGCAIVSTRFVGSDEMLEHGVDCLLAEVGDIEGLASAMSSLLADDDLRDRIAKAALAESAAHTVDAMVAQYLACYDSFSPS